jgi:hypothetical protein
MVITDTDLLGLSARKQEGLTTKSWGLGSVLRAKQAWFLHSFVATLDLGINTEVAPYAMSSETWLSVRVKYQCTFYHYQLLTYHLPSVSGHSQGQSSMGLWQGRRGWWKSCTGHLGAGKECQRKQHARTIGGPTPCTVNLAFALVNQLEWLS